MSYEEFGHLKKMDIAKMIVRDNELHGETSGWANTKTPSDGLIFKNFDRKWVGG